MFIIFRFIDFNVVIYIDEFSIMIDYGIIYI